MTDLRTCCHHSLGSVVTNYIHEVPTQIFNILYFFHYFTLLICYYPVSVIFAVLNITFCTCLTYWRLTAFRAIMCLSSVYNMFVFDAIYFDIFRCIFGISYRQLGQIHSFIHFESGNRDKKQESCAIAKMTARCALWVLLTSLHRVGLESSSTGSCL